MFRNCNILWFLDLPRISTNFEFLFVWILCAPQNLFGIIIESAEREVYFSASVIIARGNFFGENPPPASILRKCVTRHLLSASQGLFSRSAAGTPGSAARHLRVWNFLLIFFYLIWLAERILDFSAHVFACAFDKKILQQFDVFIERSNIKKNSALLQLAVHIYHY